MKKGSKSSKLKIVLAIILCVVIAIVVPTGIYCAVKQESPVKVVRSIFVTNETRIIGKWQNDARTSAYEFKDNGTYDSYFSTFTYSGDYVVKGDELTLSNPSNDSTVTYQIKVSKNELYMVAIKEGGLEKDKDEETEVKYNRVEKIKTKSISEIINGLTEDATE